MEVMQPSWRGAIDNLVPKAGGVLDLVLLTLFDCQVGRRGKECQGPFRAPIGVVALLPAFVARNISEALALVMCVKASVLAVRSENIRLKEWPITSAYIVYSQLPAKTRKPPKTNQAPFTRSLSTGSSFTLPNLLAST